MSSPKRRKSLDSLMVNLNKNKKIISPQKSIPNFNSAHLKKLKNLLSINDAKILEIKRSKNRHHTSFHFVGEDDKYRQIQKNIQKKILNISMKIIKNCKFVPDLEEFNKQLHAKSSKVSSKVDDKIFDNLNTKPKKFKKNMRHSAKLLQIKEILNEKSRRIKRINNLYDSFGEDESDKDKEQGNYGLNPRSIFMDVYDIFLLISTYFCLFFMPYQLATKNLIINRERYFVFFMICFSEVIFIIDLIFGFFRWFYNNEFILVSESYMIVTNYLYGNFIFDLIMAIPFYTLLRYKDKAENIYDAKYNEKYFLLKILVCFKAFKILKLNKVKNNRVTYFFNTRFSRNYYFERIYQVFNFAIIILSMFNLIICFHIYIAELSYPNWIVSFNLENKSFIDIYITSFYFIMATMTSVGYGDIVCINKEETFFQIILLSIGLVAYSFIISSVGDYIKNKNRAMINFNKDMNKLEEIRIAYPNMPFKLYNKIQQHIQRMLHQNKKYEYNILVNSLPYTLQNSVLFEMHKDEISKFTFFKNCDNSDFILKVLTHFIPIFSKKNIVLVGEGEFFENIFFIKDGRLSLEAIIDLDNIEISIEKYLNYRYEEFEKLDEFCKQENLFEKSIVNNEKSFILDEQRSNKLFGIINKQFENIGEASYMHESNVNQEIGQIDFHMENEELYKGNIEYIHILDLLKNEYFGEILMFSNIPNPLSLKVTSKRVELYVLRKKDAFNIKRDYQNIWRRIERKSLYNIKSLKFLTIEIINRYCEMNGILKGRKILNSNNNNIFKNNLVNYKSNNIYYNNNDNINNTKLSLVNSPKIVDNSKLNLGNVRGAILKSFLRPVNAENFWKGGKNEKVKFEDQNLSLKSMQELSVNKNGGIKNEIPENKEITKGSISPSNNKFKKISKSSSASSLNFNLNEKKLNKKFSPEINYKFKNNIFQRQKYSNQSNKRPQKKSVPNFRNNFPRFASMSNKNLPCNFENSNQTKKNNNKNIDFDVTGISSIKEINISNSTNNLKSLSIESNISLQISSSYKNINQVAKGHYLYDNKFQNLIEKIINYYIKNDSKKKKSEEFNYYKYICDKIKNDEFNGNFTKQSQKNNNKEKNSLNYEKNKVYKSSKIQYKFSNSSKNKSLSSKENKNNFNNNKKKDNVSQLVNNKFLLDSGDNTSLNSINKINSIPKSKDLKIFSENDNNESNIQLKKNDNSNYRHVQTFQEIKKEIQKNSNVKKNAKKKKSVENLYSNNIINNKSGNSFHEVNLNYVNNFCCIY